MISSARVKTLVRSDLTVAIRDGEQLLLTLGLPVLLLVFFSKVDVVPTGSGRPVDFLAPGVIALALLSVSFVRLAIGLGFDRGFGAIKRLAITPLTSTEFLTAKALTTLVLFAFQILILILVALTLGWDPHLSASGLATVCAAIGLGLVAFCGLAFVVASLVEGLTTLAVANSLYVLLLLLSGLVFDLEDLPNWLASAVKVLPSTAVAELLRSGFDGFRGATWAWVCLLAWGITSPILASRLFRWE